MTTSLKAKDHEVNESKRWSSVPVLTNGMLVIFKKIESYDVRSDEK